MSLPKAFLHKQKAILISEKDKLAAAILKLKKYPDYGDQDDDNTMELIDYENNLSLEENLDHTLKKVNKALKDIENGTYGECKQCLDPIEKARLEMMPFTEYCSKCQKKKK